MILKLSGHIGSTASALVDGQLSHEEEERAWAHVLTCPGCRRLVEEEGRTKRQLGSLCDPMVTAPPPSLMGSLYDVDAWAAVDRIEKHSNRRRAKVAAVGSGAIGITVMGLLVLTSPPVNRGEVPGRQAPATIRTDVARPATGSPTGAETNIAEALRRR